MALSHLLTDLQKQKNQQRAKILQRFFKTGKGEYGEGDVFWGIMVPQQRATSIKHLDLSLKEIAQALKSPVHEVRLSALLILVHQYKIGSTTQKEKIFKLYTTHTKHINNWDLIDLTAPHIVGDYLFNKKREILYTFARSNDVWKKRIAILSTYMFIKNKRYTDTLQIAKILLHDSHDLIHKAVGWMLREVGKKDLPTELRFLNKHAHTMPRTMLRYAIEKLPQQMRVKYLKQKSEFK